MIVRLRFARGPKVQRKRGKSRQVALALASLLTPAALMTLVLALWRLGTDLGWAGPFAVSSGFFSHWQVWIGVSAGLFVVAAYLNRYGHEGDRARTEADSPQLYRAASSREN
jgi:hypothetical protein